MMIILKSSLARLLVINNGRRLKSVERIIQESVLVNVCQDH